MKMRSGRASSASSISDDGSGVHKLTRNYVAPTEMSVNSFKTIVMTNNNAVAVRLAVLRNANHAVECCYNAVTLVKLQIYSIMVAVSAARPEGGSKSP